MKENLLDEVREFIEKEREEYTFDKQEFGKVLFVASSAIFVVSIHTAISLDNTHSQLEENNRELDQIRGIIQSDSFSENIEAVQNTLSNIDEHHRQVGQTFNDLNNSLNNMKEMEKEMEQRYRTQQWIILFSIIGAVSGLSIIYI